MTQPSTDDLPAPLREALEMVRNDQAGWVSPGLLNALKKRGLIQKHTELLDGGEGSSVSRWEVVKA